MRQKLDQSSEFGCVHDPKEVHDCIKPYENVEVLGKFNAYTDSLRGVILTQETDQIPAASQEEF